MKKYNEELTFTNVKQEFDHVDQITQPPVIGTIHQLLIQYQANNVQPLFGDDYNETEYGILPNLEYMDQLEVADFLQNFEERRIKNERSFFNHTPAERSSVAAERGGTEPVTDQDGPQVEA